MQQQTTALQEQTRAVQALVTTVQAQGEQQDQARTALAAQLNAVTTQMQQVLQRGLVGDQAVGGTVRARIRSVWQGWRRRPPEDR